MHQIQWYTPMIPVLRRQRQEDHKFKPSLDYSIKPCLKTKQKVMRVRVIALELARPWGKGKESEVGRKETEKEGGERC